MNSKRTRNVGERLEEGIVEVVQQGHLHLIRQGLKHVLLVMLELAPNHIYPNGHKKQHEQKQHDQ